MKLAFRIAIRFLQSNKGQTLLIILGISIGISVQIFIGSLISGLQKDLIEKTIGNSSQVTLLSTREDKIIDQWQEKLTAMKKADPRIQTLSPTADSSAFLKYNGKSFPVLVRGFDLDEADKIYAIKNSIYAGKEPSSKNEILLGRELNDELNLTLGEEVSILTPDRKEFFVTVVGLYDLKVSSLNKSWAITNLETAQSVFSMDNQVTSIETQLLENSIFESDEVSLNIERSLDSSDVKVDHWKALNEQLLSGLQGQSISSLMIQVFVLISVVLGIASILAISVVQRSKQIGILKAMGIRNQNASLIFLFQGMILGIFGAILGILLGLGLSYMFSKFAVTSDNTPVVRLSIDYTFISISAIIAVASASLASVIPAVRSAKLEPIEVIRNG